jgi:8-oxo-dGTP pyrophosphatase MutT (NUDIX family)
VTVEELARRTRQRLAARQRRVVPKGPLVQAAVLVPILGHDDARILFAKRTDRGGTHKGQISFPGGVVGAGDASFEAAALRECQEEIGLPPEAVELLGALDDSETFATQFIITPLVGVIRRPVTFQPDGHEIEKVIEVPVESLLDDGNFRVEEWERGGALHSVYFFDYHGETIWGATARILKGYLDLVKSADAG